MKNPSDGDRRIDAAEDASALPAERSEASPSALQPSPGVEALSRELRETQAELRRLRAFLSHGLRQPMAALTIWAELLNAKQASALDEQGRRYLRELTASVHRIAAMLASEVQGASSSAAEPRPGDEPPPAAQPATRKDV